MSEIAIVGMSCIFPDAASPVELWETVLAQRRAFRRIPSERFRLDDYLSPDLNAPDSTYATKAGVIEGYEFDRVSFRVSGDTWRSADSAHWLGLDVAAQALKDAGFPDGEGLPHETAGVFLGNTLTGDLSRANGMRLRWPYVRRVVEAALLKECWSDTQICTFLETLQSQYKAPFPATGEESLVGAMSNTIAGRICNYFDLKGGGYTVDGACASSLLSVSNACAALQGGDLDIALSGGVDLSLDPFEIVGFAKVGALAREEMLVYDVGSNGFWPGEGCGFVVLMRYEDALSQRRRIYAVIRGWGISSDGSGGITRPEIDGQILALKRAYSRAGYGIDTVAYFEGHGTGTSIGDAIELSVLSQARWEANRGALAAVIGTIKGNIGHTKAAAGIAGLIKASMALHNQVLPPITGCENPRAELNGEHSALRVLRTGMVWPSDQPLRAGVSAMGFGGVNAHIALEGVAAGRRKALGSRERSLISSWQDAEIFLLGGRDVEALQRQVDHLLTFAGRVSQAELADLAARMESTLDSCQTRAALVASSPEEFVRCLETLESWIASGETDRIDIHVGVFLGGGGSAPAIGFLFPGQGSPPHLNQGALRRRFEFVRDVLVPSTSSNGIDPIATDVVQPAIVTASISALQVLHAIGIEASVAVGHSLGEITALHWAGALDEAALLRVATARGELMSQLGSPDGAMASIRTGQQEVEELLNGQFVVIAGLNSPSQTIVSGNVSAVENVIARAQARGLNAVRLPVSHAFHSPLVAAAASPLAQHLSLENFQPLSRTVVSTVTGAFLTETDDLRGLLFRQMTQPVRFTEALNRADEQAALWVEVGPGDVLSRLASESVSAPVVALDSGGPRIKGLLQCVGSAFALGAPLDHKVLFQGRFTRPFNLDWSPRFFENPCELAPVHGPGDILTRIETGHEYIADQPISHPPDPSDATPLDLLRQLVADRTELPWSSVKAEDHLLTDLHLNSISVGEIVVEAARCLGLSPPVAPTDYADATLEDIVRGLGALARNGGSVPSDEQELAPAGVDSWIRPFIIEQVERPLPHRQPTSTESGDWEVIAPYDHQFGDSLTEAFHQAGVGRGVVVCLPPDPDERHVSLLLAGARALLADREANRFVLVQQNGGAAAFARTLYLESQMINTCVVDVPLEHPQATEWVVLEAIATEGYSEARYDTSGRRWEPVLRLAALQSETGDLPLGPSDVLLVTGGGKGIAAECALNLAQETGVRLALLGRSQLHTDVELETNLQRMDVTGVDFQYISADVTDEEAVRRAIKQVEATLGPVTAILHGAGTNVPQLINDLDEEAFLNTLAPKVQGARNVLAAINPDHLRLFITFGSIIARTGMRGEADYAVANEWLTRLTERFQAEYPKCRCIAIEWSVWSGVGMGERLGRIDALVQQGITPISPDDGISILRSLIAQPLPQVPIVVTGRFGEAPTLKVEEPELPFLRFLEHPRVNYGGVELVVDTELSADTERYLDDHVFQGQRILPGVIGLEAIAQVAVALTEAVKPPIFENVKFLRPIVVPDNSSVTVRVAALVREPGRVQVVLRSDKTGFQVDHLQATCCFESRDCLLSGESTHLITSIIEADDLPINPEHDLYGSILFHGGRFRRLSGYKRLRATECIAEISADNGTEWFANYLPGQFVLGDPGARDAAIHAIQSCIPHGTLLPVGVDKLVSEWPHTSGPRFVYARERWRKEATFVYDVEVTDSCGQLRERWDGLELRMVADTALEGEWVAPLLGPYLERKVSYLIPGAEIGVQLERHVNGGRRSRSDQAIRQMFGPDAIVQRRPDGKPELASKPHLPISVSHAGDLTLVVSGPGQVGGDIEPVVPRSASLWQRLLGHKRFNLAKVIAQEKWQDLDTAATRVWTAAECLKKAGAMLETPLLLVSATEDGWIVLAAGPLSVATVTAQVQGADGTLVLAVLARSNDANL